MPMSVRQEFVPQSGRVARRHQAHHPSHENRDHGIKQRHRESGRKQRREQAFGLAGIVPIESHQSGGRIWPRRLMGGIE